MLATSASDTDVSDSDPYTCQGPPPPPPPARTRLKKVKHMLVGVVPALWHAE